MNAAQLIAWLVCLVLAFFACVVAVHNTGQVNLLRQQLQDMRAQQKRQESAAGELKKIRGTLQEIEKAMEADRPREGGAVKESETSGAE